MSKQKMDDIIREHKNMEIPKELENVVNKALLDAKKQYRRNRFMKSIKILAGSAAASVLIFTAAVNSSPSFAGSLSEVPIVGNIVRIVTISEQRVQEDGYDASIKTPVIEGLNNQSLQESLNEKYIEENKKLYDEFLADMENMEENGGGHLGVDSGYEVKTDNDRILSIGRYVVNTVASSSTTYEYDTIDKERELLITLPSLFKDKSYIDIISENIKKQMVEQHQQDELNYYWVEGIEHDVPIDSIDLFEKISANQSFYINNNNNLVISFDKYEVAPGYMGMVEFEIPTEILSNVLVGKEYLK